jgi:hypothetical protein
MRQSVHGGSGFLARSRRFAAANELGMTNSFSPQPLVHHLLFQYASGCGNLFKIIGGMTWTSIDFGDLLEVVAKILFNL